MARGEREGQLLDDGRTRVAEDVARDGHHADVLVVRGLAHQVGEAVDAAAQHAFRREALDQRVDAEVDVRLFACDALACDLGEYLIDQVVAFRAAEYQLHGRNREACEQRVEVGVREVRGVDAELDRVDARIEHLQRFGIGLGGVLHLHGLVHVPAVVGARTAYERELSGLRAEEADAFEVLGTVVGADIEALTRFPHQFALVVSTFQVGRNHLFPLLRRDGGKLGEQLFTLGICHNYLVISISVLFN